jgi:predicted enzyme related to lactoylglutathione lyase
VTGKRLWIHRAGYLALELGAFGGGIVECQTPRPLWLPYVQVTRIDHATERARDLGAAVLLPRERIDRQSRRRSLSHSGSP